MKKTLVIALLFLFAQLQAQVRFGETEAHATAQRFIEQQAKQQNLTFTLNEAIYSKDSGLPNLFVFSIEPKGFVLVSALGEVLAYSLVSAMPTSDELPAHIAYWLELYNNRTDYLMQHPEQRCEPTRSQNAIGPLLTSCWGQGCYHNAACPADAIGPCGHVSAGCVAIAMAQIMYYHKLPSVGTGSMTYTCSPYGTLSANFGQTTYRWDEMADTLHGNNPAVAQLISHCGISVRTEYSPHESSAFNLKAVAAFRDNFFYIDADYSHRHHYNDESWITLIRKNLNAHLPLYYTGTSDLGGHAFVCDGYDNNGLFHFNFGWDGVADGFYNLNDPSGFSKNQFVIHNLRPLSVLYLKEEICEGDTYFFFGRPIQQPGHYSTTYNCQTYELDLNINPLPTITCSNDTLIEYGHSAKLTAFGGDNYLWSTGDTTQSITVYPREDQYYNVTGWAEHGCSNMAYVTVRVINDLEEMILYPNPAHDKIEIYMPFFDELEILNQFGQQMYHVITNREAVVLDVSRYVNGVYFVHIRQMHNDYYKKLIINH